MQCVHPSRVMHFIILILECTMYNIQHLPDAVAPGLCWAGGGGWAEVDPGDVAVCRVRR